VELVPARTVVAPGSVREDLKTSRTGPDAAVPARHRPPGHGAPATRAPWPPRCRSAPRDVLRGLDLRVALHRPLLPGDLVEVLVVQHQHHQPRVVPGAVVLGRGQHLGHAAHLHRAIADHGHRDQAGEGELRGDRIGDARHHRGQVPRQGCLHPAADPDLAGEPVSRRPRVRGQDRAVRQLPGQLREQCLRADPGPVPLHVGRLGTVIHQLPPLGDALDDLLLPGPVLLAAQHRQQLGQRLHAVPDQGQVAHRR
jgi:hypothetical protein